MLICLILDRTFLDSKCQDFLGNDAYFHRMRSNHILSLGQILGADGNLNYFALDPIHAYFTICNLIVLSDFGLALIHLRSKSQIKIRSQNTLSGL